MCIRHVLTISKDDINKLSLYSFNGKVILIESAKDALSAIKEIDQQAEQQLLRSYLRGVVHGYCEPESVELLELTLASNEAASLNTIKALREAIQEDQQCIDIKVKAGLL